MSDFAECSLNDSDVPFADEQGFVESNSECSPLSAKKVLDESKLEKASRFLFAEDLVGYISHEFHGISYEVKIKEGRDVLYNAFNEKVKLAVNFIRWKILKVHSPLFNLFEELCKYDKLYYQRFVRGILGHYSNGNFNPGIFLYLCAYIVELASICYKPNFLEALERAVYATLDAISILKIDLKKLDIVVETLIFPQIEDCDDIVKPLSVVCGGALSQQGSEIKEPTIKKSYNERKRSKAVERLSDDVAKKLRTSICINESDLVDNDQSIKDEGTEAINKLSVGMNDLTSFYDENVVISNSRPTKDEGVEAVKLCAGVKDSKTCNGVNQFSSNSLSANDESTETIKKLCVGLKDFKTFEGTNEVICNFLSTKNKNEETIHKLYNEIEALKTSYKTTENKDLNALSTKEEKEQKNQEFSFDLEELKLVTENKCAFIDSRSSKEEKQIVQKLIPELEKEEVLNTRERIVDMDSETETDTCSIQKRCFEIGELKVISETNESEVVCHLPSTNCENEKKENSFNSVDNGDKLVLLLNSDETDSSSFCPDNEKSSNLLGMDDYLLEDVMSVVRSEVSLYLSEFMSLYSNTISDSCAAPHNKTDDIDLNASLKLPNIESKDSPVGQDQLVHPNPGGVILTQSVDMQQNETAEVSTEGILSDFNNDEKIGNNLPGIFHALCEKGCNDEHLILLNGDTLLFAEDLVGYIFQEFYDIPYDEPKCNEYRDVLHCGFNETIKHAAHFIHLDIESIGSLVFEYIENCDEFNIDCYKKVVSTILSCYSHDGLNSEEFLYQCVFFAALASRYRKSNSTETKNLALNAITEAFCMLTGDWDELNDVATKIEKFSRESCVYRSCKTLYDENLNLTSEDCNSIKASYLKENYKIMNKIRKYISNPKACQPEHEKCTGKLSNPLLKFENSSKSKPEESNNAENISLENIDDQTSFFRSEKKSKDIDTLSDHLHDEDVKRLLALSLEVKSLIYKALVNTGICVFQTSVSP